MLLVIYDPGRFRMGLGYGRGLRRLQVTLVFPPAARADPMLKPGQERFDHYASIFYGVALSSNEAHVRFTACHALCASKFNSSGLDPSGEDLSNTSHYSWSLDQRLAVSDGALETYPRDGRRAWLAVDIYHSTVDRRLGMDSRSVGRTMTVRHTMIEQH